MGLLNLVTMTLEMYTPPPHHHHQTVSSPGPLIGSPGLTWLRTVLKFSVRLCWLMRWLSKLWSFSPAILTPRGPWPCLHLITTKWCRDRDSLSALTAERSRGSSDLFLHLRSSDWRWGPAQTGRSPTVRFNCELWFPPSVEIIRTPGSNSQHCHHK